MNEQDGYLLFADGMVNRGSEVAVVSANQRGGLSGSRFQNECFEKEIRVLSQGLLSLSEGTFAEKGFVEKFQFMEGLQKQLEGGVQEAPFLFLKRLHGAFRGKGAGRSMINGTIPAPFLEKIIELIREDPFPRIRVAAVKVLIRLGEPQVLGTALEDYLLGLLNEEALSGCTVLDFMVEHFGHRALWSVLCFLEEQDTRCPSSVLRLMEALCEEHLTGLDVKWALMQLKKQMIRQNQSGAGPARQSCLELMSTLNKFEYARLANFQRQMEVSRHEQKAANKSTKKGKEGETKTEDADSQGTLEKRLLRIRCGRGLFIHGGG